MFVIQWWQYSGVVFSLELLGKGMTENSQLEKTCHVLLNACAQPGAATNVQDKVICLVKKCDVDAYCFHRRQDACKFQGCNTSNPCHG